MNVNCPRCGAENGVDGPGLAVVCGSCFHSWVPTDDGGATAEADSAEAAPAATDGGEDLLPVGSEEDVPTVGWEGAPPDEIAQAADAPAEPAADGAAAFAMGGSDAFAMPAADSPAEAAPAADLPDFGAGFALGAGDDAGAGAVDFGFSAPAEGAAAPVDDAPDESTLLSPASEFDDPGTMQAEPSMLDQPQDSAVLTEGDRELIGTYQRKSTSMNYAADVVWGPEDAAPSPPPSSPPPRASAPVSDPSIDPFSETDVVWPEDGPRQTAAWGGGGASQTAAFGDSSDIEDTATFSDGGADPFGTSSSTAAFGDDPFGGGDPFATGASDDPFASSSFGGGSFGTTDLGGNTGGDPFGSADFQSPAGDFSGVDLSDLGGAPEPAPSSASPRTDPRNQSSFFIEGASASSGAAPDDGGYDLGLDTSGGGGGNDAGGLFEVDMPAPSAAAPMAPPSAAPAGGGARPNTRRSARGPRKRKAKSGPNKGLLAVLGLVLIGGIGVVGADYAGVLDLGIFGEANKPAPKPPVPVRPPTANKGGEKSITADAPKDYIERIAALTAATKGPQAQPADTDQLMKTLCRLQERYPGVFKANPEYAKQLKSLATPTALKNDRQLLICKLLAEGKDDEAAKQLDIYITTKTTNPDDLYLMARVAKQKGEKEKAIALYERVLKASDKYQAALFDLGQLYLETDRLSEARGQFEKLLETSPNHSGGKLAMAQIALYEKGYDDAKTLIDAALALAKDSKDPDEQFRAFRLQALLGEAQGKPDDRRYALERALEIEPTHEQSALELADLLTKANKGQEALQKLKACQKAGCTSAPFYQRLVEAYLNVNQKEDAWSQLSEALRNHPDDTGLLMLNAKAELAKEHVKTAKSIYAQITELDPNHVDAYLELAKLQVAENKDEEALDTLTKGIEVAERKLPLLERKAEIQLSRGATLEARRTMDEILKLDPENIQVKLRFAKLMASTGYADQASRYYKELDIAGALDAAGTLDFAEVLFKTRHHEDAMGHIESILSRDPLDLRANVLRGAVHTAMGEYRKAEDDLKKALRVNSESAEAYYYLGKNELAQERSRAAVEHLSRAVDLDPKDHMIRYELAKALTGVGGVENRRMSLSLYGVIINDYEVYKQTALKSITAEVYLNRGKLYFENGQHKDALADFKKAMLEDPTRLDLLVEFGRTLTRMRQFDQAEAYLFEVLERQANEPSAHYLLGNIYLEREETRKAEDHFKRAIKEGGANFPDAHLKLAYIYKGKGLKALACDAFKQYLRVAPDNAHDLQDVEREVGHHCG